MPDFYSMKAVAPTVCAILGLPLPKSALEPPIAPIVAGLKQRKNAAVLALDALGILPWSLWKDEMPFLKALHEKHSITIKAIMPSITPVNFACMLTGAELETHGIQTRELDFKCETLYDVLRKAGAKSLGAGYAGYTGELLLARCADIPCVAEYGPPMNITDKIIAAFASAQPRFTIAQFGEPDTVFHKFGPSDPQVIPTLQECDKALEKLTNYLATQDTNIIILADHGQHDIPNPPENAKRGKHGTDTPEDRLVPCTWAE